MLSAMIVLGFFVVSAAIGLIGAALAPGGLKQNAGAALGVCVGAPALIIAASAAVALVAGVLGFVGQGWDG